MTRIYKKSIWTLIVALLACLVTSFSMALYGAKADVTATYSVILSDAQISTSYGQSFAHDTGKVGVRFRSKASGTTAEGVGFAFADRMTGDFEMDFRVTSKETYRLKEGSSGGWTHSIREDGDFMQVTADDMNPFLDLKEVAFTFTSATDSSKFFTVFVRGTCPKTYGQAFSSYATVYIPGDVTITEPGRGYGLPVGQTTMASQWWKNATLIGGTSFSNYTSLNSGTAAGGTTTSNLVKFDATNMKVFVNANNAGNDYATKNEVADILVRDLTNPSAADDYTNDRLATLSASDFANGYTVKVEYTDVTDNATVGNTANLSSISGPGQYATLDEAYERYADMIIYSVNGTALTEETLQQLNTTVVKTQSSLLSNVSSGLTVSEDALNSVDNAKGLTVRSTVSGTDAEGLGFAFADTMYGAFELDFRVKSAQKYVHTATQGWSHYVQNGKQSEFFSDAMNPYLDLKEVAFTFTSATDPDKYFTVYIRGASPGLAFATTAYVYIGGEQLGYSYAAGHNGYGLGIKDGDPYCKITGNGALTEYEQMPKILGTSFSNFTTLNSQSGTEASTTSNILRFDAETMRVYVNAPTTITNNYSGYSTDANYLVRDLATNAYLDTKGAGSDFKVGSLSPHDFVGGYTVKVTFTDMTEDDYTTPSIEPPFGGIAQYPTGVSTAYARYADMTMYALNGERLTYAAEGKMNSSQAPYAYYGKDELIKDETVDVTPKLFGVLAGNEISVWGKVSYSYDNESFTEIAYDNGYAFTPDRYGKLYLRYEDFATQTGIPSGMKTFALTVRDTVAPQLVFSGVESAMKWSIGDTANKPVVKDGDIVVANAIDEKSYEGGFAYVECPNGAIVKTPYVQFTSTGIYKIYYTVTDNFGNESTVFRTVEVGDFSAPVITAKDLEGKILTTIDLTPSISDYCGEGNLTVRIEIVKDGEIVYKGSKLTFNPSSAGRYTIIYTATDASGNSAEKAVTLTVVEGEVGAPQTPSTKNGDTWGYILLGISALVVVGGVSLLVVRRRKMR